MTTRWLVATMALAAALPAPLWAQMAGGGNGATEHTRMLEADRLHADLEPENALAVYRDLLNDEPDNFEALWKAAREAVGLGIISRIEDEQNRWFKEGEGYARRAAELYPDDPMGHFWLASAMGRRAVQVNFITSVTLAGQLYRETQIVLRMDSLHAGAHHVLGQLNVEVMGLPSLMRMAGRRLLGAVGRVRTSWEFAESFLLRAVALDSVVVNYHLDLGRMYMKTDRPQLARHAFQRALALPVVHPHDLQLKRDAQELLDRLDAGRISYRPDHHEDPRL
jgi:tetratricopeptide (TPR) repeat protein